MKFYENNKRSLMKVLTYRALSIMLDTVIVFALTRQYDITFAVLVLTNVTSAVVYFFHERLWNNINWGRNHQSSK